MRKNRSVKDNSIGRGKGSKGKEISIELQPKPTRRVDATTSRYENDGESSNNITERLNYSSNWQQNPSISQNILKEIINYSNISQPHHMKSSKGSTVAIYDKHTEDVYAQLAKMSKKSSLGDLNWGKSLGMRKQSKKLTIDHSIDREGTQMTKSIDMVSSKCDIPKQEEFKEKNLNILSPEDNVSKRLTVAELEKSVNTNEEISYEKLTVLQQQMHEKAIKMDQLSSIEDGICHQYSQMIPSWQSMIETQLKCQQLELQSKQINIRVKQQESDLQRSNLRLLFINKEFINSRRSWDQKGNGARSRVIEEVEYTHDEFIRKVIIRDFEQTVLFNMKVVLQDHKGKTNVKAIYEELFRTRSAKKFTMILKKHSSHMDLYDGKLLTDFTKRINDLEGQYWRSQTEITAHPDEQFLSRIEQTIVQIDRSRNDLDKETKRYKSVVQELQIYQEKYRVSQRSVHVLIDEMNYQVRGEYIRYTEKQADFKALLLSKYSEKYKEFRQIRSTKLKLAQTVRELQGKVEWMRSALLI